MGGRSRDLGGKTSVSKRHQKKGPKAMEDDGDIASD
jgi:hypothetical protein